MKIDNIVTDDDLIEFLLDQHEQTKNSVFLAAANSIWLYRHDCGMFKYSLSETTRWTSMDDDKPKKNGYYFCYHMTSKCGDKEDWQINKLYWEDNLWLYHHNSFKVVDYVTHWMPIPAPPVK